MKGSPSGISLLCVTIFGWSWSRGVFGGPRVVSGVLRGDLGRVIGPRKRGFWVNVVYEMWDEVACLGRVWRIFSL